MNPLVSAIIPTYNSAKYIPDAIESALAQTYGPIEIIVVDDGSTDNTKEAMQPYLDSIQCIHKENNGPASARNIGIKNSKGAYIAFLDADDVWLPNKLELQMEVMLSSNSVGIVSCGYCYINSGSKMQSQVTTKNYLTKKSLLKKLLLKNVVSNGSGVLTRRICFEKVGLFDENLRGTEDWDMWLRIARYWEVKFVESPLMKIGINHGSVSSFTNAENMLKNELKFLNKLFTDAEFKNKHLTKARAYSTRYLSAAIAYRENNKLSDMRACAFKAGMLYPPHIFTKKFLGIMKDIILLK